MSGNPSESSVPTCSRAEETHELEVKEIQALVDGDVNVIRFPDVSINEKLAWAVRLVPCGANLGFIIWQQPKELVLYRFTVILHGVFKTRYTRAYPWFKKGGRFTSFTREFITKEESMKKTYHINGRLRFTLAFEMHIDTVYESIGFASGLELKPGKVVDYSAFLGSQKYADVTFQFGERQMKAHRIVLSARSQYFSKLFDDNDDDSVIKVEDVSAETFYLVLSYIYTNHVNLTEPSVVEKVLSAAEKFELEGLVQLCENVLYRIIEATDKSKVFDYLAMTYGLNTACGKLKAAAMEVIVADEKAFYQSDRWKKIKGENPALAIKILESVVESKGNVNLRIKC